jgi:hypothetical protein
MSEMAWSWKRVVVKNRDGRTGTITDVEKTHSLTALTIAVDGDAEAYVQLGLGIPDTGEAGWFWLNEQKPVDDQWEPLGSF